MLKNRIRELRLKNTNYSLAHFCRKLKVVGQKHYATSHVSRWENNLVQPMAQEHKVIAEVLGVESKDLFTFNGTRNEVGAKNRGIVDLYFSS